MRLLPLILVALAHLPLLIVYFQQLWDRPHYQFFPLVLGVSGYFLWQRWGQRDEVEPRHRLLSYVLVGISLPILAYAFLRLSPMFAYLSFVLVLGSFILRLGIPALGPWLLLLLVIRIPYGQDVALIQWMQRLTTRLSSTALDTLGIEHIADGNVLLFPTTSLFVEEACSGVVSLLAIVACAGILAVWWRRSIIHSLSLLSAAIFLAGAMNVVRVVMIAIALDSFDVNLTEGWRHEATGLVIFAISLLALFSVDRLLGFFFSPIEMNPLAGYWDDAEGNVLVRLWNRYVGLEQSPEEDFIDEEDGIGEDDEQPALQRAPPVGSGRGVILDWAFALLFLMIGGSQVFAGIGPFSSPPEVSAAALQMSVDTLPEQWAEWTRYGFEELERDSSSAFGEHSRIWAYENGTTSVRISLDFVFPEWHALTACYAGVGWTVESTGWVEPADGEPYVEATFTKPNGDWAMLIFDLFDDNGRPYETPAGSFIHPKLRRILGGQSSRWNLPNYYQVQALTVSELGPLPESERQAVRELFLWFRRQMRGRLEATGADGSAQAARSSQGFSSSSTGVSGGGPNACRSGRPPYSIQLAGR